MRELRRLAVLGLVWIAVLALPTAAVVFYFFGQAHALGFLYGIGVGAVAFASIAVSVALLTGPRTPGRIMLGVFCYVGRFGFAVLAVILAVYALGWPVLPIIGGFAGVYVVENVAILIALGRSGSPIVQRRENGNKQKVEV